MYSTKDRILTPAREKGLFHTIAGISQLSSLKQGTIARVVVQIK